MPETRRARRSQSSVHLDDPPRRRRIGINLRVTDGRRRRIGVSPSIADGRRSDGSGRTEYALMPLGRRRRWSDQLLWRCGERRLRRLCGRRGFLLKCLGEPSRRRGDAARDLAAHVVLLVEVCEQSGGVEARVTEARGKRQERSCQGERCSSLTRARFAAENVFFVACPMRSVMWC